MLLGGDGVVGFGLLKDEDGLSFSFEADDSLKKSSASVRSKLPPVNLGLRFRFTTYFSIVAWLGDVGGSSTLGRSGNLRAA